MAYHESLLLTLFDVVFYLLIAKKILEIREFFWKDLVPLVVLVFSVATGSFFVPDQFNFFISTISFVIVFLIYFKLTFFQSLMLYVISIIIMIVIQLIAMIPTYFIFNGIETAFIPGLVAQSIGLIMVLICYMFVSVHLIYRLANKKNRVVKVLLFNIFLLAVGVLFYWFVDVDGMLENSLVFIGISLSLVILNGVIIRNGLRNEQEEKELGIYRKYLPVIENLTDEIRKRQHDFNNHIQTMKSIQLMYDDIETIREKTDIYSSELNTDLENKELLLLENKILAGFIYSKLQEAKEKEISVNYYLGNVKFKLLDYELIEVISILLDNAIEACKPGDEVQLSLFCKAGVGQIKVANPAQRVGTDELDKFFKKGYSTKAAGKRGYGLSRLTDIVNKYNGTIQINNEDKEKQQNFVVFLVKFP